MRKRSNLGNKKPISQFEKMLSEVAKGSEIERMFEAISGYRRVRK